MQETLNPGARRTISSRQTFFLKFVFPTIWITGFGAGTVTLCLHSFHRDSDPAVQSMGWISLVMWLLGSALIYWRNVPFKRVKMDEQNLYVSNFREEVRVPLHDVSSISESRWISPPQVIIHLARDTAFGNRVAFVPKMRLFGAWRSHPIVAELRYAAQRAGAFGITSPSAANNVSQANSDGKPVWKRVAKVALVLALAVTAFITLLITAVEGIMKSSQIYRLSLVKAQTANAVSEYIGQPFHEGRFVSGNLNESGDGTGNAVLSIPISGPKGHGRLHVEAMRRGGNWTFTAMLLEVDGQNSEIDLLAR